MWGSVHPPARNGVPILVRRGQGGPGGGHEYSLLTAI